MGGGRRAFFRSAFGGAIATAFLAACGKKRGPPPPLVWLDDVDVAHREANRLDRAVFLSFEASWDTASKELEHATYPDPDVASLLFDWFVCVRVDCSDDEDRRTIELARRFDIKGTPSIIAVHARSGNELFRATEYTPPEKLATALRTALSRHRVMHDVEGALRLGATWKRPVVLFFGPTWDASSEAMRRTCLSDWKVGDVLRESFVFADVRRDEGWNDEWARFRVRDLPTAIVLDGRRRVEIARIARTEDPRAFEHFLEVALWRYRT